MTSGNCAKAVQRAHGEMPTFVIVGSFVPDGAIVGDWVQREGPADSRLSTTSIRPSRWRGSSAASTITCANAKSPATTCTFPSRAAPRSSASSGNTARPRARVLYCSVDPELYYPQFELTGGAWDLGYLGTYSIDRQPTLERVAAANRAGGNAGQRAS